MWAVLFSTIYVWVKQCFGLWMGDDFFFLWMLWSLVSYWMVEYRIYFSRNLIIYLKILIVLSHSSYRKPITIYYKFKIHKHVPKYINDRKDTLASIHGISDGMLFLWNLCLSFSPLTIFCKCHILRLKKQELASFAQSAEEVVRAVEESVRKDLNAALQFSPETVTKRPLEPPHERAKLVISIQDKDGLKQFRVFMVCSPLYYIEAKNIHRILFFRVVIVSLNGHQRLPPDTPKDDSYLSVQPLRSEQNKSKSSLVQKNK